jgi:hypothetical protein
MFGKPRPWTPPAVTLISQGSPPLQAIKLSLKSGPPLKYTADAWGEWETSSRGGSMRQRFPRQTTPFTAQVRPDSAVAVRFAQATAIPPEKSFVDPITEALLAALEGVNGTLWLDSGGRPMRFAVYPSSNDNVYRETPNQVSTASFMALEVSRGLLAHLALPIPREPIGVGAVWKVERYVQRGVLAFLESATVTLEKYDGMTLHLSYTLSARADPDLKPRDVDLKGLFLKGRGQATVRLDSPLPIHQFDDSTLDATLVSSDGARTDHHAVLHTLARVGLDSNEEK